MPEAREIDNIQRIIEKEFKKLFKNKTGPQKKIYESMEYSLFSGGKRIRPILLLKSCELVGGKYYKAMSFALAIEMIHTYSLIHDDLPSMDDDKFRRNKLTNHKVFGEAIAILSGDGLLNLAIETMNDFIITNSKTIEEYNRNIRAMNEIVSYSGVEGMIGGQVVDLLSNNITMDEEKLLFMYKSKTAALIQASLVSGAVLGGGTDIEIENMRKFGLYLGLAYQIKDDILDEDEDMKADKLTYLKYNSVSKAEKKVNKLSEKAIKILSKFKTEDNNFLEDLTKKLIDRTF